MTTRSPTGMKSELECRDCAASGRENVADLPKNCIYCTSTFVCMSTEPRTQNPKTYLLVLVYPRRFPGRSNLLNSPDPTPPIPPTPRSLSRAVSNHPNPSMAYRAKKKIGNLNSSFEMSHLAKSLEGVDELKKGSLISCAGLGVDKGEGVEGRSEALEFEFEFEFGEGGLD